MTIRLDLKKGESNIQLSAAYHYLAYKYCFYIFKLYQTKVLTIEQYNTQACKSPDWNYPSGSV